MVTPSGSSENVLVLQVRIRLPERLISYRLMSCPKGGSSCSASETRSRFYELMYMMPVGSGLGGENADVSMMRTSVAG